MPEFSNDKRSVVWHIPSIYAEEMSTQSVVVRAYDGTVLILHYFYF